MKAAVITDLIGHTECEKFEVAIFLFAHSPQVAIITYVIYFTLFAVCDSL